MGFLGFLCSGVTLVFRGEERVIDILAGAVFVAALEQSQHSVHAAVVSGDFGLVGIDDTIDELGNSDFLDGGEGMECLDDVAHVGTAASEDDAAQHLVGKLVGHLVPHVADDFLHARLYNLYEAAALYLASVAHGEFERVVDVSVVGICATILELHLFCPFLVYLERGDVLGDIVAAQWYDGDVAQDVLVVYRHGGGLGAQVYEHTSAALLRLGEHAVGEHQRCEIHLDDVDAGALEALVAGVVELLAPQYVKEIAFQVLALYACGVKLELVVNLVFLSDGIDNLLFGIIHAAVGVHEFVYHVLAHDGSLFQVFDNHILYAAYRLSSSAYIHACYLGLERVFKFVDDVGQTLYRAVVVIDYSLADACRRVFLRYGEDADAAIKVLLSGHACNLGRAQFDSDYKFLCHTLYCFILVYFSCR